MPPLVDDTGSLILLNIPAVPTVTFMMIVQTPPPVILPPLKMIVFPPETAVTDPPQLLARLSGDALLLHLDRYHQKLRLLT